MKKFLLIIDPSRYIANHVLGSKHTLTHRKVIGTILIIIGVSGVKLFSHKFDSVIIHITSDILGYAFHGIGLLPWITGLENLKEEILIKNEED
jgi:hypothetical protein